MKVLFTGVEYSAMDYKELLCTLCPDFPMDPVLNTFSILRKDPAGKVTKQLFLEGFRASFCFAGTIPEFQDLTTEKSSFDCLGVFSIPVIWHIKGQSIALCLFWH